MRAHVNALIMVVTTASGCGSTGGPPPGAPEPFKGDPSDAERAVVEPEPECRAGEPQPDARHVRWRDLLADPDAYIGASVRMRGWPMFDFEMEALIQPVKNGRAVRLGLGALELRTDEDVEHLRACSLKLVEIEGDLVRVRERGGERLMLRARHIMPVAP